MSGPAGEREQDAGTAGAGLRRRSQSLRARVYDRAILPLTSSWYRAVLERISENARILDVGIGTGGALARNATILEQKNLSVVGIDIDRDYVDRCLSVVDHGGLSERVETRLESVYDHHGGPYEAIYFSASFMLLPDPGGALAHVCTMLTEDGRLYFTQTFENQRSRLVEFLKPRLSHLTSIDFGRVTYRNAFREQLEAAHLDLIEMTTLGGTSFRTYTLTVARPRRTETSSLPARLNPQAP